MPSVTTTIEENSPLITYLSNWRAGTSGTDDFISQYSDSGFMATQTPGASASFVFNGTGVKIFGAKRDNHGEFIVTLDNTVYPPMNGNSPAPGLFQQNLFSADGLKEGLHTVTITNQGTTFLDIDFITWVADIGKPTDILIVDTVQDTDSSFVYSSRTSWNTNPKNVGSFLGGSGHSATDAGASFEYTFKFCGGSDGLHTGSGVSLHGSIGPEGAPYTVQLDGGKPQTFSSNKLLFKPQVILYHANDLPPGEHHIKVTCQPTSSGQTLAFDFANVYKAHSPDRPTGSSGLSGASIAGIVIGVLGSLAVIIALFFFLRRRQRQMRNRDHTEILDYYTADKDKEAQADTYQQRAVTISSFGPGPATSELITGQNVMPTPSQISSPAPSTIRPPTPTRPSRRGSTSKHQVRFFVDNADESSNAPLEWSPEQPPSGRLPPIPLQTNLQRSGSATQPRPGLPFSPMSRKGVPPIPGTSASLIQEVDRHTTRSSSLEAVAPSIQSSEDESYPEDNEPLPPNYHQATHGQGGG